MHSTGTQAAYGLDNHGLINLKAAHWNLTTPALYEAAIRRGEAEIGHGGALVTNTGKHTGRAPKDKFFVDEPGSNKDINWGEVNRPISQARFDEILARVQAYLQNREIFVQDCYAGADPAFRLPIRVITESAWHNLFARNMFIQPKLDELPGFQPQFTIVNVASLMGRGKADDLASETFILVDMAKRLVLIGGTSYAGEIKKSVFTILNYLLPAQGVLPMHCSANIGQRGDVAIFFGLSGTGKTTLSADSTRTLIGDDEHGWSDNGVFNFEGGCYAKVIRLSREAEPEIFATTERFGTILENVVMDPVTRMLDLDDASLTENTRASYPLDFIPNMDLSGMGGHPDNVVMLTADAFGVLPPISQLSPEQAMYHFLSGYTARVAGTEKGLGNEPQATFSTCFGAPFMPRHPTVYAEMLRDRIAKHGAKCWLVNTGWSGGKAGVGQRMKIAYTRAMVAAALNGTLAQVGVRQDPNFGLLVPENCPDVPADVLDPRKTWSDKGAYDTTAHDLRGRFEKNFQQFEAHVPDNVKAAGIRAAA
ncbi:phosphoenolpyruvate carboxykinase [Oceanibaculum pacificum]|uniref:Phosphoenolpyruvate carboxykinase (ATP) n=1 Tax=Oceanibaculum pacificum TaxID=580166 RepID=A0A154WFK8_9PROT|nr:phosphoenolpyruvate carboxykinase [Oceanibaculum pacificum]KZD12292.1 phosphoenolpyruvate carboxykinase [Oceanibaculum pacificum]